MAWWHAPFIPDLCEFEANLVYILRFRIARAIWRKLVSKNKQTNKPEGPPPVVYALPANLWFLKVLKLSTGHQVFKHMSLWETFHIQTRAFHHWPYRLVTIS